MRILLLNLGAILLLLLGEIPVIAQSREIHLESLVTDTFTERSWADKKQEIRHKILFYLGQFPDKKVPLSARVLSENKTGEIIVKKVRFMSESDDPVYAYLLVPSNQWSRKRKFPAVLALHQTVPYGKEEVAGLSGSPDLHYGTELAKRGYVVLAPDSIAAGDRLSKGQQPWSTEEFYKKHPDWSAVGKAVWDNMIAIDYLQSLSFVDKDRIGVIGHSQGGVYAYFLAAFDERVKATVANCSLTTIAGDPDPFRWARDTWWIGIPKLRKDLNEGRIPFDFQELIAMIAPRAFLSISALHDDIIPDYRGALAIEEKVSEVYQLFKTPEKLEVMIFSGKHSFPRESRELAYAWIDVQLKNKHREKPAGS